MMRRQPKWIRVSVLALTVVIVLFAAVFVIGYALPKEHVASTTILVSAPPSVIWELISDIEGTATWRPNVERVDRIESADGTVVYEEHTDYGPIRYQVDESIPPRRLVTRIVDNNDFGGTWTYEIEADGGQTRVTITENGEIYSPLFRFFAKFVFGYEATMEHYLGFLESALTATAD